VRMFPGPEIVSEGSVKRGVEVGFGFWTTAGWVVVVVVVVVVT
jgi:hypothetical protein